MSQIASDLRFAIRITNRNRSQIVRFPDLPFLAFLDFLAVFVARNFLAFLSVFPFFPRDFRGSEERKNPCFFGVVFLAFPKKARKRKSGAVL